MIFVPQYKLKNGMMLASDVEIGHNRRSEAFLFKKGTILTREKIDKLITFDISGVYIEDGRTNEILDYKLRKESVSAIKKIFEVCENSHQILSDDTIKEVEKISDKLVRNINKNKGITIGISDLQSYDENTYLHSLSVTVISIAIGSELGLNRKQLCDLGVCAMLHDIGKVEIPIELISKPARLTEDEFDIVKTHASLGGNFVSGNKEVNDEIYFGIISHHERFDGTGYPNGLKKDRIPLFGRIIAVADVYDALTANRPYRRPIKPFEAIEYIMGGAGTSFDYNVVKAFLRKIEPYPIGSRVKLSDGRAGNIIKRNTDNPLRPVIKVIGGEVLDLNNNFDLKNIVILGIDYSYLIKNMGVTNSN
ncbi:HD-GYP domain-containing protein [Clostridium sp.]|uniref:HD-GYP domain-containing protein n=1 Tax=Clostridium sp. TaxID=1506 RepID=UPI002623C839|nr:HD-GYP domain-containing protein [Clostridium sp.]